MPAAGVNDVPRCQMPKSPLMILFLPAVKPKDSAPVEGAAHFNPVAVELSATRVSPLLPTARRAGVSFALAAIRSPFASTIEF